MSEAQVATANRSSNRSESSLVSRIAFGVLGLLLVVVAVVYAVLYFGGISGEEFAPDSFSRRRFAYLEVPLVGLQITPIRHSDTTNDLESYLAAQKLLPKAAKPKSRWDLVVASQGIHSQTQGDARILCQYLDAVDKDGKRVWLKWSKDHPELAKILWPAAAKVASQELYSFVPDLFVLARSATTPDELQQGIDQALADKYSLMAETLKALGEEEAAAELFAEVLHHAPANGGSESPGGK